MSSSFGVRAILLVATPLIGVHARLGGRSSEGLDGIVFVVGNFSDTVCPTASLAITDAETCKKFAQQLANKCTEPTAVDGYQSECESSTDRPVWCARQAGCSQADTGCVIFTSGTGGRAYVPYARPVCAKATFVVGDLGDSACPAGSVPITNVATCKSYAHQLSNKCTEASAVDGYQSECESNTNRPVWCERQAGCSRADTGCVIYNGNASGSAYTPYARPICINGSEPEVSCCVACLGKPYCSPKSGNCYDSKQKTYYESCAVPEVSCCGACLGKPYCSPKSGNCYESKKKAYYESCVAP